MMDGLRVASLELGGTKCIASLVRGRQIIRSERMPTGDQPERTLTALVDTLARWHDEAPFAAIGIASFGPLGLHPDRPGYGTILKTPKPGWSDTDVLGAVRTRFDVPIGFDTDVGAAALAEGLWGASVGCGTHAYLTIGTGVGLGLVIDRRIHHGGLHPEAGHVRVRRSPGDTFQGVCPFHGDCIEGLVSGPALDARTHGSAHDLPATDVVWGHVTNDLAELMAMLLLTTATERIVLGGGVALAQPALLPRIQAATAQLLGDYLHGCGADELQTRICFAGLGAEAGPLGGAALALAAVDCFSRY